MEFPEEKLAALLHMAFGWVPERLILDELRGQIGVIWDEVAAEHMADLRSGVEKIKATLVTDDPSFFRLMDDVLALLDKPKIPMPQMYHRSAEGLILDTREGERRKGIETKQAQTYPNQTEIFGATFVWQGRVFADRRKKDRRNTND